MRRAPCHDKTCRHTDHACMHEAAAGAGRRLATTTAGSCRARDQREAVVELGSRRREEPLSSPLACSNARPFCFTAVMTAALFAFTAAGAAVSAIPSLLGASARTQAGLRGGDVQKQRGSARGRASQHGRAHRSRVAVITAWPLGESSSGAVDAAGAPDIPIRLWMQLPHF